MLEVDAGPGGYWSEVVDLIHDSWDITVTDLSEGMVEQARERLGGLERPFTVLQADVQNLPFGDQTFDVVLANFMLYHVPDRRQALSEIHRVLRPGGKFYAMTNGRDHVRELNQLVESVAPGAVRGEESGFSLENGIAQLVPWFHDVRVTRYPDSLRVTEAEPLVAYVRSYAPLPAEKESALRNRIEDDLVKGLPGGVSATARRSAPAFSQSLIDYRYLQANAAQRGAVGSSEESALLSTSAPL